MNQSIQLYDLAGAEDNRRFSPPCWQVKMALRHKGLVATEIPWRFTEKDVIAFSGQGAVPVIIDGDQVVHDSWKIIQYLEKRYPDRPSLFHGKMGESGALFVKYWCLHAITPLMFRILVLDVHRHLDEKDKAYFRTSRELMIGQTLEDFASADATTLDALRAELSPVRRMLDTQPYLCGDQPAFADYVVFAQFQWARSISPTPILSNDDPIYHWRERLLDAFDGYARSALGYPV